MKRWDTATETERMRVAELAYADFNRRIFDAAECKTWAELDGEQRADEVTSVSASVDALQYDTPDPDGDCWDDCVARALCAEGFEVPS